VAHLFLQNAVFVRIGKISKKNTLAQTKVLGMMDKDENISYIEYSKIAFSIKSNSLFTKLVKLTISKYISFFQKHFNIFVITNRK